MNKVGSNENDILLNISGKTAKEILEASGQGDNYPIDLNRVLKTWNLRNIPATFDALEKEEPIKNLVAKRGEILGLVLTINNQVGIFHKKNDSISGKRYTVAHEIGHCCCHADRLKNGYIEFRCNQDANTISDMEKEANIFAGELLIPEKALKKAIKETRKVVLSQLASLFLVSIADMETRLKHLGIDYIDDRNKDSLKNTSETDDILIDAIRFALNSTS